MAPNENLNRFCPKKGVWTNTFQKTIAHCFLMNFKWFFHAKIFGWCHSIFFVQIGILWNIWTIFLKMGVWGIFSTQFFHWVEICHQNVKTWVNKKFVFYRVLICQSHCNKTKIFVWPGFHILMTNLSSGAKVEWKKYPHSHFKENCPNIPKYSNLDEKNRMVSPKYFCMKKSLKIH